MRYFKVSHSTGATFVRSSRGDEFTNAVVSSTGIVSLHRDWRGAQAKIASRSAQPDWEEVALTVIDRAEFYRLKRANLVTYEAVYEGRSYTTTSTRGVPVVGAVPVVSRGRTRMEWFIDEDNLQRFAAKTGGVIIRPTSA